MSFLSKLHLAHLPAPHNTIYVALFTDLQNGQFLRQQLIDGNQNFEYAFIDASSVVSTTHVLSACFRAMNDWIHDRLRSRNVHSEIVFGLGTNNNIAASLKSFGVHVDTRHMLAIKVAGTWRTDPSTEWAQIQSHLQSHVLAQPLPFTDQSLSGLTDWPKVSKLYKLPNLPGYARQKSADGAKADDATALLRRREAETVIAGLISLRGT